MFEGRQESSSVGQVGKDALRPQKPNRSRGLSRRVFLAGVAALGAGALVAVARGVTPKKVVEFFTPQEGKPTEEQVEAAKLLAEPKPEEFVYNIVATGEKDDQGKIIPVKIRNKPTLSSPLDDDGNRSTRRVGDVLGELLHDTVVSRARVVWGDDRDSPYEPQSIGRWLAFENPAKPGSVVFAFERGFKMENYEKFWEIAPVDIQGRLAKSSANQTSK